MVEKLQQLRTEFVCKACLFPFFFFFKSTSGNERNVNVYIKIYSVKFGCQRLKWDALMDKPWDVELLLGSSLPGCSVDKRPQLSSARTALAL